MASTREPQAAASPPAKKSARTPRKAARASALEARIGRTFKSRELLQEALTHASTGERKGRPANYERMEFLGDRVLGLVVAQHLYETFPNASEDTLALRLNALVSRAACARAARRIALGEALSISGSEERTGGREKETILADACEALIAAVYLDAGASGLKAARQFILTAWDGEFDAVRAPPRDPKTMLQEWAAARRKANPAYTVVERIGPDHAPHFIVEAQVEGVRAARGEGASKRDAERAAAKAMLEKVGADG
jgi:ribonuclease III